MRTEYELAVDTIELFKKQERQIGDVRLEGIKLSFPKEYDVQKIITYIHRTCPEYRLNMKQQNGKDMLTIGYH